MKDRVEQKRVWLTEGHGQWLKQLDRDRQRFIIANDRRYVVVCIENQEDR